MGHKQLLSRSVLELVWLRTYRYGLLHSLFMAYMASCGEQARMLDLARDLCGRV